MKTTTYNILPTNYEDPEKFREAMAVKLTLLMGACRMPSVKKKQIEESLNEYIKYLEKVTFKKAGNL